MSICTYSIRLNKKFWIEWISYAYVRWQGVALQSSSSTSVISTQQTDRFLNKKSDVFVSLIDLATSSTTDISTDS